MSATESWPLLRRQSKAVSNILRQCYGDPDAVTDELVNYILKPGLEPGAVKVGRFDRFRFDAYPFVAAAAGRVPRGRLEVPAPSSPSEVLTRGLIGRVFVGAIESSCLFPDVSPPLGHPVSWG